MHEPQKTSTRQS